MTEDPEHDFESLDRRLDRYSLMVALVAVPVVFVGRSLEAALSVAVGAGLSYINFRWLKRAVDFVVLEGAAGAAAGRRALLGFIGRYALIAVVLYATIRSSVLDVVYILAGLLVYVLAIFIECFFEVYRVLIRDYRDYRNGRT